MNKNIILFYKFLIITALFIPKIAKGNFEAFVGCHCWLNTRDTSNLWQRKSAWDIPLSDSIYVHSSFCDLDNDGDYDAYVTNDGGTIMAFENTGADTAPVWQRKSAWDFTPPGMSQVFWADFVDINGDGKCDICVSKHDTVKFYKNTGATLYAWTRQASWDIAFPGGLNLSPTYADLDADLDYDMVMENWGPGDLLAFENIGSINVPAWQEKPAWELPSPQARPGLGDLDGDGDMDMICTGWTPGSKAYENTGNILNPVWTLRMGWITTDANGATYPELIDINDDGAGVEESSSFKNPILDVFPNPFIGKTTLKFSTPIGEADLKIKIYDISGKLVKNILINRTPNDLVSIIWDGTNNYGNTVKPGIYFCNLKTGNLTITKKISLLKR